MSEPTVSINVPCYHQLSHARRAVDSMLAQSFPHFEVTLLDDGASDEYRAYVESLGDGRVRYCRNAERLGAMGNMFAAIDAGRGRYTLAFHEDDLLHRDYLAAAVEILDSHPACAFVASELREFKDEPPAAERDRPNAHPAYDLFATGAELVRGILRGVEPMFGSVVYRRAALEGIRAPHDLFATLVDRPFLLSILQNGWSGAVIREPLVWYRGHHEEGDTRHLAMTTDHVLQLFRTYRAVAPDAVEQARPGAVFFVHRLLAVRAVSADAASKPIDRAAVRIPRLARGPVRSAIAGPLRPAADRPGAFQSSAVKVIALLPIRNEAWVLEHTLACLSGFCDVIVASDQQSTDDSREICRRFPKVALIESKPSAGSEQLPKQARWRLLDAARDYEGHNLLWCTDADELPSPRLTQAFLLRDRDRLTPGVAVELRFYNLWGSMGKYRQDLSMYGPYWKQAAVVDDRKVDFPGSADLPPLHEPRIPGSEGMPVVRGRRCSRAASAVGDLEPQPDEAGVVSLHRMAGPPRERGADQRLLLDHAPALGTSTPNRFPGNGSRTSRCRTPASMPNRRGTNRRSSRGSIATASSSSNRWKSGTCRRSGRSSGGARDGARSRIARICRRGRFERDGSAGGSFTR